MLCWLAVPVALRAQCATLMQSSGGVPGVDGAILAMAAWDPDGAGPLAPRLAVGGTFLNAGSIIANRVATFDPGSGTWAPLYVGVDGQVNALAALDNGELVVGGQFGGAYGTLNSSGVARWNGSNWAPLDAGLSGGFCHALLPVPGGGVIATGQFATAGSVVANHIALWNGTTWAPLGSGLGGPYPIARALARLPGGDIVVAGDFNTAGGVPAAGIARWNGAVWSAMPGLPGGRVTKLAVLPNGDLIANVYVGGGGLWRWNGTGWSQFATITGSPGYVAGLDVIDNGDLIASGSFSSIGGVAAPTVARWNGASWQALGPAGAWAIGVAASLPGGSLYVGGQFTALGSVVARSIARWDGVAWNALSGGVSDAIVASAHSADGREFVALGDRRVLRRDAAGWTALGSQLPDPIRALAVLPNGDVVVGGDFLYYAPPAITYTRVLRWDGVAWQPFAAQLANASGLTWVETLLALPDGRLLIGGSFKYAAGVEVNNVTLWDGSVYTPLHLGVSSIVRASTRLLNGDLAIGGSFSTASGTGVNNVAAWNGSAWYALGSGIPFSGSTNGVYALAVARNGELFAGGQLGPFGSPSGISRWNGVAWSLPGGGTPGMVRALAALPNGDMVAGGSFTTVGGVPANSIARWNGTAWSAIGSDVLQQPAGVRTVQWLPNGQLAVGGSFSVYGTVSPNLVYFTSGCPASVASYGTGCTGSGGALQLGAVAGPWLGGELRSNASGLTGTSLVAHVLGFAPLAIPLASLLPAGGAGCDLLVEPVVLDFVLPPHAGTVSLALAIPTSTGLIGATVRQQAVEFELDAAGALLRINSSNALFATLGTF